MFNKVRKLMGSAMLAGMMVCTLGGVTTYANNYHDAYYSSDFNNAQKYTDKRAKEDTSKLYMKCTSIDSGKSYTAHAVGYSSYSSKTAVDCSRGKTYSFNQAGQYYYMTSWVKESGYNIAAIAGNPNYGYKFNASGKWSPDNKAKR